MCAQSLPPLLPASVRGDAGKLKLNGRTAVFYKGGAFSHVTGKTSGGVARSREVVCVIRAPSRKFLVHG